METNKEERLKQKVAKLKVGDLLWEIIYWGGEEREIRKYKIKKITGKRIKLVYWEDIVTEEKILDGKYFLTLKEALIDKIKEHKADLEDIDEGRNNILKEINFLKRKLTKLKTDGIPPITKVMGILAIFL